MKKLTDNEGSVSVTRIDPRTGAMTHDLVSPEEAEAMANEEKAKKEKEEAERLEKEKKDKESTENQAGAKGNQEITCQQCKHKFKLSQAVPEKKFFMKEKTCPNCFMPVPDEYLK
jgi:hypothetical protein